MDYFDFDVVVIGSGFGGSVSAMRLSQKGYRVAVLETGKRFGRRDFPASNWQIRKYLWAPLFRCFGFQKLSFLRGLVALHGVGVGGGSLVYANTLLKPPAEVFRDGGWPAGVDWEAELSPFYDEARRMLGATKTPFLGPADEALLEIGKRMGVADTFRAAEVGVYFGDPGRETADPYFAGDGPSRAGCTLCGGCMVGCRVGAKNTLDQNYLFFAEKRGAKIFAETRAAKITPGPEGSGGRRYAVETERSTSITNRAGAVFGADHVILAGGVLGSLEFLLKNRDLHKTLPNLPESLGTGVRTNGESLLGATRFENDRDYSKGVAIGAEITLDSKTKLETVRYPAGSSFMRLLAVPLTPDGSALTRPLKMLARGVLKLPRLLRLMTVKDWARQSVILLFMQSVDQKIRLKLSGKFWRRMGLNLKADLGGGSLPAYFSKAQESAEHLARIMEGEAQNTIPEVLFRTTVTAHVLGGCIMAESAEKGEVGPDHQVFGYPGLYVCDGSVVPVNLSVNPSLTITALAERFASLWPEARG